MLDFSEAPGVVSLRSSFSSRFFSVEIIRLEVMLGKLRYQLLEIPRSSIGVTKKSINLRGLPGQASTPKNPYRLFYFIPYSGRPHATDPNIGLNTQKRGDYTPQSEILLRRRYPGPYEARGRL